MEMINCKVNGIAVSVPKGSTILEAARAAGVEIPTLCYMKDINAIGACRICVVEATGARGLATACVYPVAEGMEIKTNTAKVQAARKTTLELILSTHDKKCLSCPRSGNCELQKLCNDYGVDEEAFSGFRPTYDVDDSAPHLVRNNNKCILCRRCVAACREQYVGILGANDRGIDTNIGQAFKLKLADNPCISCGQCTVVCPTGALTEKDDTELVWSAIADPSKYVVMMTAPAVRAAIAEEFGNPIGTPGEGKMVAAIRRLGADKVFDIDFGADVTIVEEATELVQRIQNKGVLPMITSCSPGWIRFIEQYYPDQLSHLSTCKSPMTMSGAIIKTYFAEKMGLDAKDIVVVGVMPCTAKKYEIHRADEDAAGVPDVDIS
ncbi:MAG: (2Fe-2S)-binding protein, partial [Clostridia bacterium]|nr:(2Fe-2S)-binding protein [Clostridia bacterium]